ncbi:hypothetical protein ABMY26_35990 (plasmid) [Azospirillum sp. HJ39]|uniref:hypothetical protein n=1 Tax=Azospirillum sp. HJ39 TaxID=3159496 RepID=UPI0035586845
MTQTPPFLLRTVEAHRADGLDEAGSLYRAALVLKPADYNGLQLPGLVEKRFGRSAPPRR